MGRTDGACSCVMWVVTHSEPVFPCVCLQNADYFTLNTAAPEDGKGKCPYDPAKGHTGLIVGECPHGT